MKVGIFLAYHPDTPLSNQGLGRLLLEMIKGFSTADGTSVVVVCPSWFRKNVETFLDGQVDRGHYEIIGPDTVPVALRIRGRLTSGKRRTRRMSRLKRILSTPLEVLVHKIKDEIVGTLAAKNLSVFVLRTILFALVGFLLLPFLVPAVVLFFLRWLWRKMSRLPRSEKIRRITLRSLETAKRSASLKAQFYRLFGDAYDRIFTSEMQGMSSLAEARSDVDVWYSPTVFWPEINNINAITVQAFPDATIADYPSAFGQEPHAVHVISRITKAIEGGQHFTAYSHASAQALAKRFLVPPSNIHVIRHAAMDLSNHVRVTGTMDDKLASEKLTLTLLNSYRNSKWLPNPYLANFNFDNMKFLFYASQFRPNKNIPNLLKSFNVLLRERYCYCKLILTGDPQDYPEIIHIINSLGINNDVLFAHAMPEQVLAAMYYRASLVVNPALSEGGFPFTFTEGMSVGTPSVMSRMAQTSEAIPGELADVMLFDPLSIEDMADKIQFGLNNREKLIELQTPLYNQMKARRWADVAIEHIRVFESLSKNKEYQTVVALTS